MSAISNLDLLNTGTTVKQLREALAEFPPDAYLSFLEFRYSGGGDEEFETDLVLWLRESNGIVYISPKPDVAGLLHIQAEAERRNT